jgi:MFS family permease
MVTADRRLVRAYRRLIRFYPPGPRRDELLDTLIECAPAGRRRPAVSTIANLIWHGTRARLGRPRSTGIVVLALFIALAAGFVGASAASRLGLEAVGSLPVGAEAAEINDTVFPGLTVWGGGDADKIVTQGDGDGVEYGYAISWVKSTPATRNVAGYTAATRARLETAGWTITSVDPPLDETDMVGANPADRAEGFTAERDALTLHFDDYLYPGAPWYDGDGNATYSIWHRQPWWLTGLAWLGGLLAAALAWLLTGWMSRRVRSAGGAGLGVTGAVCCLIGVLPAALLALPGAGGGADETVSPYWQGLVYLGAGPAVLAGIVAALMVVVVFLAKPPALLVRGFRHAATWPGRVRRRPRVLAALLAGATIMAALSLYRVDTRHLAAGSCTPVVPSGVVDPSSAHLSYRSRIFIDPATPAEERNLIEAAFGRSFGGGYTFSGSPTAGFTDAFCSHGQLAAGVGKTLPWYWNIDLASPGLFTGMANEVKNMPGIVAVQHLPSDA